VKNYRILIEYKEPNEFGALYEEKIIKSRSSCGKIADDCLNADRDNVIRSVEVSPLS